ncbi:MAG TPA: DUF5777 family beta-barrel protein [Thermoanaerobaculia bacterium]|jgi:hypothetical protein
MTEKAEVQGSRAEVRCQRSRTLTSPLFLLPSSLVLLAVLALPISAQQPSPYTPTDPIPLGDVLLSLPTSHIPTSGAWEIKFTHRFNQSIDQGNVSDRIHSLFGLDSNADVSIGASWAVRRDLELSILRSNVLDDIELAAKYVVFQQAPALPGSLAIRIGGDVRTEKDVTDRSSLFVQAILSHQFGKRFELFAIPSYATNAGRAVSGTTSNSLFSHAVNVPVGGAFVIRNGLSVVGELVPKNRDLPDGVKADIGWAFGLKEAIGGHYFEVLLTNNNATHVDQYLTSTYQGSPLSRGDLHLGFNIERRFGK